jgi:acylphosphatase
MVKTESIHLIIEGRVQGVGFRYFIKDLANSLSITGWVRNLQEGKVEILAEGDKSDLQFLIDQARTGPRGSLVSNVHVEWLPPTGKHQFFMIAPSE